MHINMDNLIKKVLMEYRNEPMQLIEDIEISYELRYHLENKITLSENIFRMYSNNYFALINEVRKLYKEGFIQLNEEDTWIVESDLGKKVLLENGDEVWLDAPIYEEEADALIFEAKHRGKNVRLGSPFRTPGRPKKFAVYVKTPRSSKIIQG